MSMHLMTSALSWGRAPSHGSLSSPAGPSMERGLAPSTEPPLAPRPQRKSARSPAGCLKAKYGSHHTQLKGREGACPPITTSVSSRLATASALAQVPCTCSATWRFPDSSCCRVAYASPLDARWHTEVRPSIVCYLPFLGLPAWCVARQTKDLTRAQSLRQNAMRRSHYNLL